MKRLTILLVLAVVVFTLVPLPAHSISWDPSKPRYVHRPDRLPTPISELDPYDIENSARPGKGQVFLPYGWLDLGFRLYWFVNGIVADDNTGVTVEEDDVRTGNTTANTAGPVNQDAGR